ncbi:MAG: helix-turn-helix transcriptional regulator [Coriobacteriia bacterium]|nr:helix-turn-helix transcriptional regulator [Coriobacteriia bacterium]
MAVTHDAQKEITTRNSSVVSILVIALGIASFRAAPRSISASGVYAGIELSRYLPMAIQMVIVIFFVVLGSTFWESRKVLSRVFWISVVLPCAGTLLALLAMYPGLGHSPIIHYAGMGMFGAASAIVLLGWGVSVCSLEPRRSIVAICLGFFFFSILTRVITALPATLVFWSMAVFPLASSALLAYHFTHAQGIKMLSGKIAKDVLSSLPWGILILLVLCNLAIVIMNTTVSRSVAITTTLSWPLAFGIGLGIVYFWVYAMRRDDPVSLWPMFVLLLLSCLLVYLTSWQADSNATAYIISIMQQWSMMFYWILLAALTYRLNLPPITFFGLGNLVIGSLGVVVVNFSKSLVHNPQEAVTLVIALLAFFIIVVAFHVLGSRKSLIPVVGALSTRSDIEDTIDDMAHKYCLSERELDVVGYLVRGYTFRQMSKEMFISLDTVRSYSKNLYTKLGIHKKQELFRMIEDRAGHPLGKAAR